ncbi:unnamed protein product [Orchesella dallaii]|uniref:Uncharacterized protein n=1 Tax=Orchesella dallaii TaxID=48710 RepID=A0ABP1RZS8_9HEXA
MRSIVISSVLLILVGLKALDLLVPVEGKQKTCQSVMKDLTKMQISIIMNCTKRMKFRNGKEKAKKMNCILRCAMMTVGILNEEGQLKIDQTEYFLHKFFPDELIDKANSSLMPCTQSESGDIVVFQPPEEDEYCTSYDGFCKCMIQQLPTLCD